MKVSAPEQSPIAFEIKSATLPLVAMLLRSSDLDAVEAQLASRYGDIPDFFDRDPLLIELSSLPSLEAGIDFARLVEVLRRYRVLPIAVRGGGEQQMRAALDAGLAAAPEARLVARAPAVAERPPESAPAAGYAPALVVERTVRAGQRIYGRGRDVVISAMVNPGGEVIADGNVHVYGTLRGRAMAGASGDTATRIFALGMSPELVGIAGIYQTAEVALPAGVNGRPAQVRLAGDGKGDRLLIEPIGR